MLEFSVCPYFFGRMRTLRARLAIWHREEEVRYEVPIEARENASSCWRIVPATGRPNAPSTLERHMGNLPGLPRFARGQRAVWERWTPWEAAPVTLDSNRRLYRRIDREVRGGSC